MIFIFSNAFEHFFFNAKVYVEQTLVLYNIIYKMKPSCVVGLYTLLVIKIFSLL
jgi:hypothetical protein